MDRAEDKRSKKDRSEAKGLSQVEVWPAGIEAGEAGFFSCACTLQAGCLATTFFPLRETAVIASAAADTVKRVVWDTGKPEAPDLPYRAAHLVSGFFA